MGNNSVWLFYVCVCLRVLIKYHIQILHVNLSKANKHF